MNHQKKPRAIITDFDRTLAYLYRDTSLLYQLNRKMIQHYGQYLVLPSEFLNSDEDGYLLWHKLHQYAKIHLGDVADAINQSAEAFVTDFEIAVINQVDLLPGIAESCRLLNLQGIELGVVSNNGKRALEYALNRYQIRKFFTYIGGRAEPFSPDLLKPSPHPINLAIESMDLDRKDGIWYTGDDRTDIFAAINANVIPVGIYSGRHSESELIAAGAVLTLPRFNDLTAYIRNKCL